MNAIKFISIILMLTLLCWLLIAGVKSGKLDLSGYSIKEAGKKTTNNNIFNNYAPLVSGVLILVIIAILALLSSEAIKST